MTISDFCVCARGKGDVHVVRDTAELVGTVKFVLGGQEAILGDDVPVLHRGLVLIGIRGPLVLLVEFNLFEITFSQPCYGAVIESLSRHDEDVGREGECNGR